MVLAEPSTPYVGQRSPLNVMLQKEAVKREVEGRAELERNLQSLVGSAVALHCLIRLRGWVLVKTGTACTIPGLESKPGEF